MERFMKTEAFLMSIFDGIPESKWRIRAISHSHAVSRFAALLAKRRGMDAEIAAICGLLHDLYAYEHLSYDDHAHLGAQRAGKVLDQLEIVSLPEKEQICSAIWHHDDLDVIDHPLDELLKDADLLDNAMMRPDSDLKEYENARLKRLYLELGIV